MMISRLRKRKKKKGNHPNLKLKLYGGIVLVLLSLLLYFFAFSNNVNVRSRYGYFFIPEAASPENVYQSLKQQDLLRSNLSLWLMLRFYPLDIPRKGLYKINRGWGNMALIYALNHQKLKPYLVYEVPSLRIRSAVVKKVCDGTGVNTQEFYAMLQDTIFLKDLGGFDRESIYCIFIPGQHKINRRCTAEELLESLHASYCRYWNKERAGEAKELGYTPEDLTILASIVYAETKNVDEMPIIAGLYMNRLKKNMRLEADPTLIYAKGSHQAKRVYKKFTLFKSKYNTYRHKGLPPGPIGPAPLVALEAALHPATHDYLYFCANEDLSGCHIFSETYASHKKNAERYRKVLDKNKVR
jgi:UPF0755 protein